MRALTAVLLQIQAAHVATQHGESFRGETGSQYESACLSFTPTCLYSESAQQES